MKKRATLFALAPGLLARCRAMFAHLRTGLYYGKDPVRLKGSVTDFEWGPSSQAKDTSMRRMTKPRPCTGLVKC